MINENEIAYDNLQLDKSNGVVNYNDELHKYWIKDSRQACISVTTLIHKFTTFDEAFWASYKALEALSDPDRFKGCKTDLLNTKVFSNIYIQMCGVSQDLFDNKRQEILLEWQTKRDESCVRGSTIHKEKELGHLVGISPEIKQLGLGGKFTSIVDNNIEIGKQAIYPEILLSYISEDYLFRLAGQADLVIVDGHTIYILDYKTSKKIEKKSYYDRKTKRSQMMRYPLNNLEDTNFWHYSLQLSTYAWMIEKRHPEVDINKLVLIHYDHDGHCTPYECEYLKKDVERMISFYKKEVEHQEFVKSREKIEF